MGQILPCPAVVPVLPPPIIANVIGSWAYRTVSERMATILRTVLATFAADEAELIDQIGADGHETVEVIQSELEKLLDSLMNNRPLGLLTGMDEDVNTWNMVRDEESVEGMPPQWHDSRWLYVECFMYRKIYDVLDTCAVLEDYDYFRARKSESFNKSISAANELGISLLENVSIASQLSPAQVKVTFMEFLMISLWGNKCDMSLSAGMSVSMNESPMKKLQELAKFVVIDHTDRIFVHLNQLKRRHPKIRIDFILDNAGFELFADFCLADLLMALGLAHRITFHVKPIPWFVSDATGADVAWLMDRLKEHTDESCLSEVAARWQRLFVAGVWEVATSTFWTSPFTFAQMAQRCPPLYWQLQGADLLLVKGDLNYRKLVGDRPWPPAVGFCRALDGFHPAPLAALRILKADVVVGVPHGRAKRAAAVDRDWMTAGRFALIQMCRHVTPLDML